MSTREAREILGVVAGTSKEEIKRRFRILSRDSHPDRGGDEKQFINLNVAYQTLIGHGMRELTDEEVSAIEKIILGIDDDEADQGQEAKE